MQSVLPNLDAASLKPLRLASIRVCIAAAVVIAAGALQTLVTLQNAPSVAVIGGGAALFGVAVAALRALDRGQRNLVAGLVVVDLLLLVFQLDLQHGRGFIVAMPLLCIVVVTWSIRAGAALILPLVLADAAVGVHGGESLAAIAGNCSGFAAASLFVLSFSGVAVRERTARARVQELAVELAGANDRLREHAANLEDLAAAKERNRIAREIHDSVGHGLTVVTVQMEAAKKLLQIDAARALQHVEHAQTVAREALAEVRRSVGMLRQRGEEARSKPLVEAVRDLVDECRGEIEAALLLEGTPRALSPAAEFTLYRAAQEALTNVRRHARARAAQVVIAFEPDEVRLCVKDDGAGATEVGSGFGLVGMRERAALLGGKVDLETRPGEGFSIWMRLPA